MQFLPPLGIQQENCRPERKQHHGDSHSETQERHEPGTAITSIPRDNMGRHGDQKFENAAPEQPPALPGYQIGVIRPLAHAEENEQPYAPR